MKCVECLPILGCLVKGCEDWLYCDVSGDISIDLCCSGHTEQLSIIANGMWSSFIVLSISVSFLHHFNIKLTNENLNIFRYNDLSESNLFLKIFWIMGRKHIFIQDWLFCWNFVLFFILSVFILSYNCCLLLWAIRLLPLCVQNPCFQRHATLGFTLLRNNKFNSYRRCVDKGCAGEKVKTSSFTPLVHFPGQDCWIWVWSNQMLLF